MKEIREYARGSHFGEKEIAAVTAVIKGDGPLTRGIEVEVFEKQFANLIGSKYSVAVSSCSAALRIAFQMLVLKSDDEVIVPANAFWNSINPILECGAKIRVADIIPYNLTISPESVRSLINKKTRAILALDFGGNPCNYDELMSIANQYGLIVIEDAAHATGSYYNGKHVGALPTISCFSFSTLKNISTLGEGGMLCTSNEEFASNANFLRNCYPLGIKEQKDVSIHPYKNEGDLSFLRPGDSLNSEWKKVQIFGSRYTMTSVQAAVGSVQLSQLPEFMDHRKQLASIFSSWVKSKKGFKTLNVADKSVNSWHLYPFFITAESNISRDTYVRLLKDKYLLEIINRYWPVNLNSVMRYLGSHVGLAPDYEKTWFTELVTLPISQNMSFQVAEEIVERLEKAYIDLV